MIPKYRFCTHEYEDEYGERVTDKWWKRLRIIPVIAYGAWSLVSAFVVWAVTQDYRSYAETVGSFEHRPNQSIELMAGIMISTYQDAGTQDSLRSRRRTRQRTRTGAIERVVKWYNRLRTVI